MKTSNFLGLLAFGCCLFLSGGYSFATTFANRTLGEVVKEAAFIVRGRAGDSHADWDKAHQRLYTYTSFKVTDVLKGALKENSIMVRQPGGSKDGLEMNVPGAASFNPDEDLILLLGSFNTEDQSYDVPGFTTGKYIISNNDAGEPVLTNALGGGAVYDPSRDAKTASYSSQIPLEVFRKLAKGEDIPEANHKQFRESEKPAPKGSYDADHKHSEVHRVDAPKTDSVPAIANERIPNAEAYPPRDQGLRFSWSAAAAAGIVAVAFGLAIRQRRKRNRKQDGKGGP